MQCVSDEEQQYDCVQGPVNVPSDFSVWPQHVSDPLIQQFSHSCTSTVTSYSDLLLEKV